ERGAKQLRLPRQWKTLARRAGRSGDGIERVCLPLLAADVVEERAELRPRQGRRLVGDELDEGLKVALPDKRLTDAIDDLDVVSRSGPVLFDHRDGFRSTRTGRTACSSIAPPRAGQRLSEYSWRAA